MALRGEGHQLRMRVRRHFLEPAWIRLSAEGRELTPPFPLAADTRVAYRVIEVPLPRLAGTAPFELRIDAASDNPRPLGMAVDWVEIERRGAAARVLPAAAMQWALALAVLAAFAAPRLAGASLAAAAAHAGAVLVAGAVGSAWDILAADRILRAGVGAYAATAAIGVLLVRWAASRRFLGIEGRSAAATLVLMMMAALAIRLVALLHPQFFYPDVRVHANVAWQLHRRGLVNFLREFTVTQYRFSLGLQMENGHWYAFPYPPAFYLLCWPLLRTGLRPEVVVSVLAAAVNSLGVLVVYGIGRRLGLAPLLSLGGAAAHVVLPLFLARLTLAYFPALVGQFVDAVVILVLLASLTELQRPRVWLTLGGLLALAFLTYTQSLLNFALLLPLFLLAQIAFDKQPGARRRQIGLAAAGALGVVLSLAVFYGRYVPVFLDMRRGVPMPEEQVLLEKLKRPAAVSAEEEPVNTEPDDPFAGPTVDLTRGMRKASWRLYVFYGPFALAVVVGLALLVSRHLKGAPARFAAVWAFTYLLLNVASAGLPGPNLVRYNKDLEIVAPLFCLALSAVGVALWNRRATWARILAAAYAVGFVTFGATRAVRYLTEKFVMER